MNVPGLRSERAIDIAAAVTLGVFATAVAAIAIQVPSFWVDEAASLSAATRPIGDLLAMLGRIDAVHGAYYLGLHAWVLAFGASEGAVRLLSALAAGATVSATFVLTRQLVVDRRLAIVAALVLTVLPRATWMGIEARSFAFSAALAAWATVSLVQAARRGTWWWAVYSGALALGVVVNIYLVLLALAHAVSAWWLRRDRRGRVAWLLSAAAAAIVASPVVLIARSQSAQLGDNTVEPIDMARNILINQWFLGATPTGIRFDAHIDAGPWMLAAICLAVLGWGFAVFGTVCLVRETGAVPVAAAVLLPWLLLPTILVAGWSLVGSPLYNARYFTFCVAPMAILIAVGITALRPHLLRAIAGVALLVLVAPIFASQRIVFAKNGSDWSVLASVVGREGHDGDGVYFAPLEDPVDGEVHQSARAIGVAYPAAFAGMPDVTLLADPAQRARLFPGSRPLTDSTTELAGLEGLWVIRPKDDPAGTAEADAAFLGSQGYHPDQDWQGPITTAVHWTRGR